VVLPRATTHRWVPAGDEPLRLYCIEANSHIGPAEAVPVQARAVPGARAVLRARPAPAVRAGGGRGRRRRGLPQAPRPRPGGLAGTVHVLPEHPFDVVGWDGCLYPVRLPRQRLRADHRTGAPAAAGAPGVRGGRLRRLQLRAAQGRLPPARRAGAVLPLQRRQRRGDVLRRRRLRGPQGQRHRAGLDQPAPGWAQPRPAAGCRRAQPRRGVLRRARRHGRHLPAPRARRGRRRVDDGAYAWSWAQSRR
jgi:hypothetical protein